MKKLHSNTYGASVLIAVLLMSAGLFLIAWRTMITSISDADLSLVVAKGRESLSVAEGCAEETLHRIRMNEMYGIGAGIISLAIQNGSCTILVTDLGGGGRSIFVTGTVAQSSHRLRIECAVSGGAITITSWRED